MLTLRYKFIPCQGKGNYANVMISLYNLPCKKVTMLKFWYNFLRCQQKGNYANIMI